MKILVLNKIMCAIVLLGISCSNDNNDLTISNSQWRLEGRQVDYYYDFGETTFLYTFGYYENSDNHSIKQLTWRSGTYSISLDELTLNVDDGCDKSRIGQSDIVKYSFRFGKLVLHEGDFSIELSRTQSIPTLSTDISYGYTDYDNYAQWVSVESCSTPF